MIEELRKRLAMLARAKTETIALASGPRGHGAEALARPYLAALADVGAALDALDASAPAITARPGRVLREGPLPALHYRVEILVSDTPQLQEEPLTPAEVVEELAWRGVDIAGLEVLGARIVSLTPAQAAAELRSIKANAPSGSEEARVQGKAAGA